MTYPKGYSPPPGSGDGSRPSSPPSRKGHGGAIAALIVVIILIIAGISVYSSTGPHQTLTSTSVSPDAKPSSTTEPSSSLSSQPSPAASQSGQSGNCDSSYPDFCIPSPPPDLNCADISQKRFTVTGSDPHGFDRDSDGVGCES